MSLEQELTIFFIVSLFSMIDISLTYYILWYDRRLNPKVPRFKELNPLAALIMRLTNYGPWGLLIGAIITQTLIWYIGIGMAYVDPLRAIALGNFFAGAMFVAIWIHTYSIRRLHKDTKIREIMGAI